MMKVQKDELCPELLVRTEKNVKDLEKILLQRALVIKDERIRNLESKLADLNCRLEESKSENKTSDENNNVTIIEKKSSSNLYLLCPEVLVRTEKNAKDLEKILLQRALFIKDERIRNLESKLADLNCRIEESRSETLENKTSEENNNFTIIKKNSSSNFYFGFTLLIAMGVLKVLR